MKPASAYVWGVRPLLLGMAFLLCGCVGWTKNHPMRTTLTVECGPNEITATERADFDKWIDASVGAIVQGKKTKGNPPAETLAELEQAQVDWSSFLMTGPANYEFPKMLYYNEFYKLPAYYANPFHLARTVTHRPRGSTNVRSDGQINHSSFFTNTQIESYTPAFLATEVAGLQPVGKMEITKIKDNRTSEGIWIKDERGKKYIVLFDPPFGPEMSTSAEFIGSTLARIVGFHVPKTVICTVVGTGNSLYDGRRAVATVALSDFKGGWLYQTYACRREVRAARMLGAWVNNVDQTEQNTGMTVTKEGSCRHYVLDFGASLGSFTFRPQIARMGWTRLFDAYQQFTQPLYDHGIRKVPWEAPYQVHSPAVGYFTDRFDPDRWQPFYTNMGFIEETESDRIWIASRIARVSDEQIRTVVALAGYSREADAQYIADTLIRRRDCIARRYLGGAGGAPVASGKLHL